jgi:thiamine-phosphate pyrophosphorylase
VILHALVADAETARSAIEGGATVIQLRVKGAPTDEVRAVGAPLRELCRTAGVTFVVNDDVDAALALEADGVHLGRTDSGVERALAGHLLLGLSVASVAEARDAERCRAAYVGAGPVWATPTKLDADPPIGLAGLAGICRSIGVPVVAIGGVDATNAARCIEAGAAGVAVVRAAADIRPLRQALDRAAR